MEQLTMPYLHPRRRRALLGWAVTDTALGLTIALSNPHRFDAPAWTTAKQVAPMRTWGLIAFALGTAWLIIGILGRRIPWPRAGYMLAVPAALLAGWHGFFWAALCFASIPNHHVALTGCVIYLGVAFNHVLFAVDQV